MKHKIEPILDGNEYEEIPPNMVNAGKFFEKFDNIENLLRDTVDRSRMSFGVEDIKKFMELMYDRFQIKFVSIDNRGILAFRNNEATHRLYVSLLCYREESINAVKEIIHNIKDINVGI